MTSKLDFQDWVVEAIRSNGGRATVVDIAKYIWSQHERELRGTERLLYTWQYDMRWAAHVLRRKRVLRSAKVSPRGVWELV